MERHRFSRASSVVISIMACALVASFFFPELVSAYWHLRHGNSTSFHGSRIPIPWGWWASTDNNQLIIQKMIWTYDRSDPTMILVLSLKSNATTSESVFKQLLIHDISKDGYVFRGERDILVESDTGSCLEFHSDTQRRNIRISCWSWKAHLSLDLFGYDHDVQPFYSVVNRVKQL